MNYFEMPYVFFPKEIKQQPSIHSEIQLTRRLHDAVNQPKEWKSALNIVTDKYFVRLGTYQSYRFAEFNQPIIDDCPLVDGRIMEAYSPLLQEMIHSGKTDTQAGYAILELFLRTNYHALSPEQITELASHFQQRLPNETFEQYQQRIEKGIGSFTLPEKTDQESWVIQREIMDILEISDHINNKYLSKLKNRTIFITDLMRISSDALQTAHEAITMIGSQNITQRDMILLSGKETPIHRRLMTFQKLITRPEWLFSIFANKHRDLVADIDKMLHFEGNFQVIGSENIPSSGPVIIAFSHMTTWRDPTAPDNWEMAKLIQHIRQVRPDIFSLIMYTKYFSDCVPKFLQPIANSLIEIGKKKASHWYGMEIIDVSNGNIASFIQSSLSTLTNGRPLLISPEGVAAKEIVPPQRGLGTLARLSGAPTVGVAFKEEKQPDGTFIHQIIITPPQLYEEHTLPGSSPKEKEISFAHNIMRSIAQQLPISQRGIYR